MNTEIKPARKHITPSFAKWEPPAKFLRQSPPEHRDIPFADDKDYIKADKWDKWVALALGVAVLIVVALDSAWLMGWLK